MSNPAKTAIGFDMDGVIVNQLENKKLVLRMFGLDFNDVELASDILGRKIKPDIWGNIQNTLFDDPAHALQPPLFDGAEATLKEIQGKKIPYFLISRRKNPEMAIKLLKLRGLWPKYFSEKNSFFVSTKEKKNDIAKSLGVVLYIDDQPSVLAKLADVPHKLLLDPLGSHGDGDGYTRVSSWSEFSDFLRKKKIYEI